MYSNANDIKYETTRFINELSLIVMTTLKYRNALNNIDNQLDATITVY